MPKRGLNRTSQGVGHALDTGRAITIAYKDLSSGAARLVDGLRKGTRIKVGSGVRVDDLRQASIYLNRELGVARDRLGNLVIVRGQGTEVAFRASDRVLVHTHPVLDSMPSHFAFDIKVADDFVEAVVDWAGNVTHFSRNGILTDILESPINPFGFIFR